MRSCTNCFASSRFLQTGSSVLAWGDKPLSQAATLQRFSPECEVKKAEDQSMALICWNVYSQTRTNLYAADKQLTINLAFAETVNPCTTSLCIQPHADPTLHFQNGLTHFAILISSTLTKLMCRDGCNYKHNTECNHPIMIADTWESVSNHVCSLIF